MSNLIILDRLLEQSSTSESKEHVLEQAHYAMDNVEQRMLTRYDDLVTEISGILGAPDYNANTEDGEGSKNPLPGWVMGGKQAQNATVKVMRLSYWRRENGISYLLLRREVDSKDRPKYFDVVLGGRKRSSKGPSQSMTKLRTVDSSLLGWIKRLVTGNKGDDPKSKS